MCRSGHQTFRLDWSIFKYKIFSDNLSAYKDIVRSFVILYIVEREIFSSALLYLSTLLVINNNTCTRRFINNCSRCELRSSKLSDELNEFLTAECESNAK